MQALFRYGQFTAIIDVPNHPNPTLYLLAPRGLVSLSHSELMTPPDDLPRVQKMEFRFHGYLTNDMCEYEFVCMA